ncbi:MAG: hypothetical protein U0641_03225 [Anaerolineae bacterium]
MSLIAASAITGHLIPQYIGVDGFLAPTWLGVLFAGVVLLMLFVAANRRKGLILTALVCGSALVDVTIATGTRSPINLTMIVVTVLGIAWLLQRLGKRGGPLFPPSPLNRPLLAFLSIVGLSWLAAYATADWRLQLPANAFQVQAGQVAMFGLSATAFWVTASQPFTEKTLKAWMWIIVALGFTTLIPDLLAWPRPFPFVTGSLLMWGVVLLTGQLLFNPALGWRERLFCMAGLAIWVVWVAKPTIFDWKGGWVPALIGLWVLFLFYRPIWCLLITALMTPLLFFGGILSRIAASEISTGTEYRFFIWRDVIGMTSKSWLLGLGPVNYMYTWRSLGWDSTTLSEAYRNNPASVPIGASYIIVPTHNMYMDIFAQTGILGLVFFVTFAVLAIRLAYRLAKRQKLGFLKGYTLSVLAGLVAMLIGSFLFADWFMPFVYNITISGFRHSVYSWLLLGTLVSLHLNGGTHDDKPVA